MATAPVEVESPPRKRSRRKVVGILVLGLIAALVLPPLTTVNRFRNRLEAAMSAAVGRKVTVHSVRLRFLPQPGFELDGFAIHDDPLVNAEPLLRADRVTANLRMASLWRGRIEIARLDLKGPSLNLVRAPNGEWNLEQVLLHAYQVPLAPTANRQAEARPRFPYIDAEGGRVNLKIGAEKKVYALSDADFALWLATENEWNMRLTGRPIRTDANLGDTGKLWISGSFTRSPTARQTPLRLNLSLENAQLGQLSQLMYGRDRGWRGGLDAEAQLTGSPSALNISARISVQDFRRYDIGIPGAMNFEITCGAAYSGTSAAVPSPGVLQGTCSLPRDRGVLNFSGFYHAGTGEAGANIVAAAFPVSGALDLAKRMKRGMALDLTGEGTINGSIELKKIAPLQGSETAVSTITAQAVLRSNELNPAVDLGTLVFTFQQQAAAPGKFSPRSRDLAAKDGAVLFLQPAQFALGGAAPIVLNAFSDHAGYRLELKGDAEVARLRALLSAFGMPDSELPIKTEGRARVDLHFEGPWAGFAAPTESGSVRLEPAPVLARKR